MENFWENFFNLIFKARRYHYLRSTYQINGVFASPWYPQNDFEKRLMSVKEF